MYFDLVASSYYIELHVFIVLVVLVYMKLVVHVF